MAGNMTTNQGSSDKYTSGGDTLTTKKGSAESNKVGHISTKPYWTQLKRIAHQAKDSSGVDIQRQEELWYYS